jgi:phosphonate transport system ATP-binding protein
VSAAIVIEGLRKVWLDGSLALDDVALSVEGGEVVAILGGSGAGKSTLLRCASRLIEPTAGRVVLGGIDLTAARGASLRHARATIGFVFQQFNLVKSHTALTNVMMARLAKAPWWRGMVGAFEEPDRAIALRCLRDVGMAEKANALARELSGGQQQRVAIARAFAQEPKALFADEPTASLDPRLAETVLAMLRDYGTKQNVPVLINVHTIEHARRFADRVIGLHRGRVVHVGPVSTLDDATVEKIYARPDEESA